MKFPKGSGSGVETNFNGRAKRVFGWWPGFYHAKGDGFGYNHSSGSGSLFGDSFGDGDGDGRVHNFPRSLGMMYRYPHSLFISEKVDEIPS